MHRTDPAHTPEILDVAEQRLAVVVGHHIPMDQLPPFYDAAYSTLQHLIGAGRIVSTSAAVSVMLSEPTDTMDLAAGFAVTPQTELPIDEVDAQGETIRVEEYRLPAGRAAVFSHLGAFDEIGAAWGRLVDWADQQGLTIAGAAWEVYVTEPTPEMDPAELRTDLYLPVE